MVCFIAGGLAFGVDKPEASRCAARAPPGGRHSSVRRNSYCARWLCQSADHGNLDGVQVPWSLELGASGAAQALDAIELVDDELENEDGDSGSGPGAGSGGSGHNRDDNEGSEPVLPKEYADRLKDMPQEIQELSNSQLEKFFQATSKGPGKWLSDTFPAWQSRVAADPDFPFKLLMEETVGLGLTSAGMIAARGPNILKELDFVFCDLSVGGTLNFVLTWLLQPTLRKSGAQLSRLEQYVARLPANCFSVSTPAIQYTRSARAMTLLYKGTLFGIAGFFAAFSGTALSYGLMKLRAASTASTSSDNQTRPSLLKNSLAWAGFMIISSNPRYQLLAGAEQALFKTQSASVAKLGCGALRLGNNVWGGASWVVFARAVGVQKRKE